MKRNFLYKALSALVLTLCCQTAVWGQMVANNQYSTLTEANAELISSAYFLEGDLLPYYSKDDTPDYEDEEQTTVKTFKSSYLSAFDDDPNTYAQASGMGGNIKPELVFELAEGESLIHITIVANRYRQINETATQKRPAGITIYASDDDEDWGEAVCVKELVRGDTINGFYLNNPITSKYVKLVFTQNSHPTAQIRINDIVLQKYEDEPYASVSVNHKRAKWFDLRESLGIESTVPNIGTFSYNEPWYDDAQQSGKNNQAAHTFIDTIYVHKGSSVTLSLPTRSNKTLNASSSAQTYQRWYSYRTGKTFAIANRQDDNVYDLLTPTPSTGGLTVYRFENGYVGNPVGDRVQDMDFYFPENDEFKKWFPDSDLDNDWFLVACDVSGYTDFTEEFTSTAAPMSLEQCKERFETNGYYEPTISLRAIYYIVGVDDREKVPSDELSDEKNASWEGGHGRLLHEDYQGGGTAEGKKYLEEYDITFPANHLSNNTDELVALSKNANSYAIPDVDEDAALTISLADDNAGLELVQTSLKDANRVIKFRKRGAGANAPWSVDDGSTATILVTKIVGDTTYNIARYNLKFVANALPLTQTQVSKLGTEEAQGAAWNYEYRSPQWMDENLNKLTELTFDYNPAIARHYGLEEYFPFPMAWDNSNYAFFDGSPKGDYIGASAYNTGDFRGDWFPQWNYYCITNQYIGYNDAVNGSMVKPTDGLGKPSSNYHIYVDASDTPGVLVRLPFNDKLCVGSELFVTAWMKSAGSPNSVDANGNITRVNDDAAVLFTIYGVSQDGTQTALYRHSSSQIRTTAYLDGDKSIGNGEGTNDWYQLYFSFINDNSLAAGFDSYLLQIENNCASTSGGDFYFDDIKIYLMQPTATVMQKEYTCTNEQTRMNIELDWNRLVSRLGGEGSGGDDGIDFCFIDETVYNNTYNEEISKITSEPTSDEILAAKTTAVEAAIVEVYDGSNAAEDIAYYYRTLNFKTRFEDNVVFGTDGKYFADENGNSFYRIGDAANDDRRLTVDFYSNLTPNRPYLMLILPTSLTATDPSAEDFAVMIDDGCNIQTRFYVSAQSIIKVNGEVLDPSTDYCIGQMFNFSAQIRVPTVYDENGFAEYEDLSDGVYFDWFFGTEEEFTAENPNYGNVTLEDALIDFRHFYPDATEISDKTPPCSEGNIVFSQYEFDIINHYATMEGAAGGVYNPLELHIDKLDVRILADGLKLIIQPIPTLLPPSESGISEDLWAKICWKYIPVTLTASDSAPQLGAGFNTVAYPYDDFAPALRIGLSQIKAATTSENALRIDLRGAKVVSTGADRLGLVTTQLGMDNIYLIDTDDPQYAPLFTTDFSRYSLPIGKVESLQAQPYTETSTYDDHMDIVFMLDSQENGFQFNPREGYTYTFSVYFEEKNSSASGTDEFFNTCYGSFNVAMKVVPEYLVWKGTATDNWNNDGMWKRADAADLKRQDTDYTTNADNGTDNGFVPMLFSNVVMPHGGKAELYMAGYTDGGAWSGSAQGLRPTHIGEPTENIQYDLMVYEMGNALTTQRYRVNICNDIHFETGAQLLHAEQLIYNKASMDIAVPAKTWTLASAPLRSVYAGDWYTNTTGTQEDEPYFTDIQFDAAKHNRLNPAVYQRSWDEKATIVGSEINTGTVGFSVPMWSAAYNDASVPCVAGGAFSVKTTGQAGGNIVFRLPKADASYGVSTATGGLDRTAAGRLLVSGLLDRSNPLALKDNGEVTATLTASQDGKYMIVGNPFMAQLNLEKFFNENTNLTGGYWTETQTGPAAGGSDNEGNNWISVTDNSLIPPFGAFFVEKTDPDGANTVKFTADMQKLDAATTTASLMINAASMNGRSGAALAYADNAADGYLPTEDVMLMRDMLGNNADQLSVYTVAGGVAASVNRVNSLRQIPLGLFAADDDVAVLTFTGVDTLLEPSIYDAVKNTDTPLTEGFTLTVNGASHGRYFIRSHGASGDATGITVTAGGAGDVSVYSILPRQVIVSSATGVLGVSVYSVGGSLIAGRTHGAGVCSTAIDGVDSGVAIVRVVTGNGVFTRKIVVK